MTTKKPAAEKNQKGFEEALWFLTDDGDGGNPADLFGAGLPDGFVEYDPADYPHFLSGCDGAGLRYECGADCNLVRYHYIDSS